MSDNMQLYANGEPIAWHFAKVAVWPRNRFIRFIHRRVLKRPPLGYVNSGNVVELDAPPRAGTVVTAVYTTNSSEWS